MTRWRSSRLFPETRTASPWIWDLHLGNSSRISLVMRLATGSGRPRRSPIRWRTLLPPASSTFPQSKILSDRFRRIAFDSIRSFTAAARYSSVVTSTTSSFDWVRSTVTPLKSNRVPTSRRTWSRALRSSCSSKSLTTSNDWSPAIDPPFASTRSAEPGPSTTPGSARSGRPTRPRRSASRPSGRSPPGRHPHERRVPVGKDEQYEKCGLAGRARTRTYCSRSTISGRTC